MVVIARWKMLNALGLLNRCEIQVLKSWPLKSRKPRSQNNLPASSKQDGTWAGGGGVPIPNAVFSLPCGPRFQPDPSGNEQHSLLALQQCPLVSIDKV
jgi:hypothetical protein